MFSMPSSDSSFNKSSSNPFSGMFGSQIGSGLGSLFGGLFGGGGDPYKDAMKQFKKYFNKGAEFQNPFFQSGQNALGGYEDWLSGMKDPSEFINNLIGKYQESPQTQYLKEEANRAGINAGSASGLTGSTPLMKQMQQNATDISSGGLNDWLSNVLGINNQYGSGLDTLVGRGQNSANQLTSLYEQLGQLMGQGSYGSRMADNQRKGDIWGGLGNILGGGLGMMFL